MGVYSLGQAALRGVMRCGGTGTLRTSTRAGPSCQALVFESFHMLGEIHTMFFAGANLGRPSSSMCISVSASPVAGWIELISVSGASSNNSSS